MRSMIYEGYRCVIIWDARLGTEIGDKRTPASDQYAEMLNRLNLDTSPLIHLRDNDDSDS